MEKLLIGIQLEIITIHLPFRDILRWRSAKNEELNVKPEYYHQYVQFTILNDPYGFYRSHWKHCYVL